MRNCLFCKIITGEIPATKVFENDKVLAFLDIKPVNHGHMLVIPKEHHATLAETPDDVAADLMRVVPKLSKAVMKAVSSPGFNIGINNGKIANQLVDHVHLHIMPRHEGDGYESWHGTEYESPEVMEKVASDIRLAL